MQRGNVCLYELVNLLNSQRGSAPQIQLHTRKSGLLTASVVVMTPVSGMALDFRLWLMKIGFVGVKAHPRHLQNGAICRIAGVQHSLAAMREVELRVLTNPTDSVDESIHGKERILCQRSMQTRTHVSGE